MPRTPEELEQAAAEAEAWLDQLDPDDANVQVKVIRPWPRPVTGDA